MITNIRFVCLFLLGGFLTSLAQAEWVDITPSVEISQTRQALDRVNRQLFSYITIKNSSGSTLQAPLQLNIINPSIPVVNADGLSEEFHDYIQLDNDLLADSEITVRVSFQLARKQLSFSVQLVKDGYIVQSDPDIFYNPIAQARYINDSKSVDDLFSPYLDGGFYVSVIPETTEDRVKDIALSINASIQAKLDNSYLFVTSQSGLSLSTMRGILPILENHPEVHFASIEYLLSTNGMNTIASDANISGVGASDGQYYLQDAGIIDAWNLLNSLGKPIGGTKIAIGVVDNNLSSFHKDLYVEYDQFNNKSKAPIISLDPLQTSTFINDITKNHGHHVVGIIAAEHNNMDPTTGKIVGISGIMHEKKVVFTRSELSKSITNIKILNAIDKGARIINLSFGFKPKLKNKHCIFLSGYINSNKDNPEFRVQEYKKLIGSYGSCSLFKFDPTKPSATLTEIINYQNNTGIKMGSYPFLSNNTVQEIKGDFKDIQLLANSLAHSLSKRYKNFLLIQAAGNNFSHSDFNGYICSLSSSHPLSNNNLCVAAIEKPINNLDTQNFTDFSNYGSVDIATYGRDILSTTLEVINLVGSTPESQYTTDTGTSFSAPIITGIAGLVWNAYPHLTASQIKQSIVLGVRKDSGTDIKQCVDYTSNNTLDRTRQTVVHNYDLNMTKVPVANAYCALKYADILNKQRAQPKNLQVIPKDGEVELTWDSVVGASFYNLYYSITPNFTKQNSKQVIVSTSPYTLTGLQNGTTYYFAISSVDSDSESFVSDEISGTPIGGVIRIDNNVVYDQSSGFYWQDLPISTPGSFGTYKHASSYCANSNLNGLNWKIPNRNELSSIVNKTAVSTKIKNGFNYFKSSSYWTSDSGRVDRIVNGLRFESSIYQWAVDFTSGDPIEILKRYEVKILHYFLDSVKLENTYYDSNFRCVSILDNPAIP